MAVWVRGRNAGCRPQYTTLNIIRYRVWGQRILAAGYVFSAFYPPPSGECGISSCASCLSISCSTASCIALLILKLTRNRTRANFPHRLTHHRLKAKPEAVRLDGLSVKRDHILGFIRVFIRRDAGGAPVSNRTQHNRARTSLITSTITLTSSSRRSSTRSMLIEESILT